MAEKFYAVKVGLQTGIFKTWEECKANVDGYPGALYKSFKTLQEAYEYLGIDGTQLSIFDLETNTSNISDIVDYDSTVPKTNSATAIAYVDGSFNVTTNEFGYGVVMFHNGVETHLFDSFNDEEMASMRNVAGEIYGSMAAMEYAIKNSAKSLTICYDYMGIEKWCTGQWQTNKPGTIAYKKFYDKAKKHITINFEKVKGHSGDKYNDLADSLAKKACGVE